MHDIDTLEAIKDGILTKHNQMDNGEKRYRLISFLGSSYILTLSADAPTWQKSHVHYQKTELYLVEKGWVLIAMIRDNGLEIKKLNENESYIINKGVPHNVYLAKDSILHAIKYGCIEEDWNAWHELDQLLQEKQIIF